ALMAWANIAVQALLPVSLSISPAVYAAIAESKQRTDALVVYSVQLGDTATSIAKQFGLTLDELKKLNSEAYKDKSLNNIQIGDTLLVPDLRLGERKPAHSIAVKMERDTEELIADAATVLATGSVESSLRSAALSKTNQSVEEWLKQYGTAKVSVNVDSDFNLTDSEADLLIGLKDTPETFSFTQLGLRHKDDRTTVNAGVGQRHFDTKDVEMLGYNLFFDHEIEAGHTRMGVGLEYWRDFLKLSANGYIGLTGWKASETLIDYDERAADGLDLRAEAYLPSHPQLGGKLKYEQYFGNEVALSDYNNLQKDPYAMTVGVNYTPIPLITAGIDYTKEKGKSGDAQLNLTFNYRLGESWDKQLDGASMAEYRSLAGSRYDLVERNNNIVLEYRKQELLKLNVVDEFNSWPEITEQQLVVNVASKYPLDRIEWEGPDFFAAGGQIAPLSSRTMQGDSQFKVTLPAYQSESLNLYTLVAKAVDNKGNESNTDSTNIEITVNNTAKPIVTDLKMRGKLEVGQKLDATYVWDANGGESTDKSNYQWGNKGETAALKQSKDIETSGVIPAIDLVTVDAGQIKEVSIQAENGLSIKGDNVLTVDSSMESSAGNETDGGTPEGEVIDPAMKPQITELTITGTLEIGKSIDGTYKWDARGGEPTDKSNFLWGVKGDNTATELENGKGADIQISETVPTLKLDEPSIYAGKVVELSVQAENGLNIKGNIATIDSSVSDEEGNGTDGGTPEGEVINPDGKPLIRNLTMTGQLELGQVLNASYTWDPQTGDKQDKSQYQWGHLVYDFHEGLNPPETVVESQKVPEHTLDINDIGHVMSLYVQAKNGLGMTGNDAMVNSAPEDAVIDPNGPPVITNLVINGDLTVGKHLSAIYRWYPQTGDRTDKSLYQWGYDTDDTESLGTPTTITTSGRIAGHRALNAADIGKVIELSVKAQNARNVQGNTLTAQSNGVVGVDPSIIPAINNLRISGVLDVNNTLKGTYEFDSQGGDDNDKSHFEWGYKGTTASFSAKNEVPARNTVGDYKLDPEHLGKVIQLSVKPINGLGVEGTPKKVDSAMSQANGNDIDMANPDGKVYDPTLSQVYVQGTVYPITAGFPRSGFKNAFFRFQTVGIGSNTYNYNRYYTWTTDKSWATVDNSMNIAEVTFTGEPAFGDGKLTIRGIPKPGGVHPEVTYEINIVDWFANGGSQTYTVNDATYATACSDIGLPPEYTGFSYTKFTDASPQSSSNPRRADGPLTSAWGYLVNYPNAGWENYGSYPVDEKLSDANRHVVTSGGRVDINIKPQNIACVKPV
ncbi:inverse autotransporter beta domain-containing protein, partial [Plesiomonas sp.]|uniref:inverse autotransporter beta domain-containing protein n=1 Tax=Plesiomonas sp. TaxID=2486279 RepID=UPI003F3DCF3D